MHNTPTFLKKIASGHLCLGTCMTSTDATLTEAIRDLSDLVWLDMEHSPVTVECVQSHAMALRESGVPLFVRVGTGSNHLISPVLDAGADGIVIPQVSSAAQAHAAVAACRYPPEGSRGFGPRRANFFGGYGGTDFLATANRDVMAIVQIEHTGAVAELDDILALPGLSSILIGSNDLAGSMGLLGQPRHPEVLKVIHDVIRKAREAGVLIGMALGHDPDPIVEWAKLGVAWFTLGAEYTQLRAGIQASFTAVRERL